MTISKQLIDVNSKFPNEVISRAIMHYLQLFHLHSDISKQQGEDIY